MTCRAAINDRYLALRRLESAARAPEAPDDDAGNDYPDWLPVPANVIPLPTRADGICRQASAVLTRSGILRQIATLLQKRDPA